MDTAAAELLARIIGTSSVFDALVIFVAEYVPYVLVLLVLVAVLRELDWRHQLFLIISTVLGVIVSRGIVTEVVRLLYQRPRPFLVLDFTPLVDAIGAAFPSGHAAFFFALAFVFLWLKRTWGWWFLAFAVMNGIARVVAGVHWITDILGGVIAGAIGFAVVFMLLRSVLAQLKIAPPSTLK